MDITTKAEKVWDRWYNIGVALSVPTNRLNSIFVEHNSDECRFRVNSYQLLSIA